MTENVKLAGEIVEGAWGAPVQGGAMPITEEEYIANVRSACKRDLPNIKNQPEHDKIMVMVCGGPTAKDHLEEIRQKAMDEKYHIFCSNKTHDWLIENGIIPYVHFMIDPKPSKVEDVRNPHRDVRYYIGASCHPSVFDALKGYNVYRLFSMAGLGKNVGNGVTDMQIVKAFFDKKDFTFLEGGTMAGLRAMTLANMLGYRTVEYYGFDSCFFNTDENGFPIYYSYNKERNEVIRETETSSGKVYFTTPVFESQARQFIKWKRRLEWINFIIHGDSLTAEINKIDNEKNKLKGRLISDYMLQMNQESHRDKPDFGAGKDIDVGVVTHAGRMAVLAGNLTKKFGKIDILDYGCGKGKFKEVFPPVLNVEVHNYDPCVDEFSERPEPADVVVCFDVLEHVEPEYLWDVIADIESLTKKVCYVSIYTQAASKHYPDGQNMHLIQEGEDFWYPKLKKYFDVAEFEVTPKHINAVLQKKNLNVKN